MNESSSPQTPALTQAPPRLKSGLALAAGILGLLVLISTLLGAKTLAALGWGLVPMSPVAAAMVALLSAAILLMQARSSSAAIRLLACALALLVALSCLGLVIGHARGATIAFEGWLLQRWPHLQLTSLLTDDALLCAALAALCLWLPSPSWRWRQSAALLAMVPVMTGVLVMVSYAAGSPLLYRTSLTPMSLPASFCSLALGLALTLSTGRGTWPLAAFSAGPVRGRDRTGLGIPGWAWLASLSIAAIVLVGGSLYTRSLLREKQTRVQNELKTIADLKAQQISAWFGERRGDAVQLEGALIQTQLRRFLAGAPSAPSEGDLRAWMAGLQNGSYRRVVLVDRQGRVRLAVPTHEPLNPSDVDGAEIQSALHAREVLIRDLHKNPGQSSIHLDLWVPVGVGQGSDTNEGALLLTMDPQSFLYPLVQSWPTPSPSAEILLVRRDGDEVLFLNELRHQADTALILRRPLEGLPDLPASRAIRGQVGLVEGKDYRGIPVLAVLSQVPGTGWHMVSKIDVAEVYGPLRQRIWAGTLGMMGILVLLAGSLGLALKHHDASMVRKQLMLSQRFEWLMREANDIILLLDRDGCILEANDRAVECYGYGRSELLGMPVLNLRTPAARIEGPEQYSQLMTQGSIRFETINQRKDGSPFPVEVNARAGLLEGELRSINIVRDISERRAQEREILRMTQLYAALSQVNQAIVWSSSQADLFNRICEVMVEFGKFDLAWIGMNDVASRVVSVAARYGDTRGMLDRITVRSDDSPEAGGAMGTAIREGCPCLINNFLTSQESVPWRAELAASELASIAAFPIRRGGEVVGALAVYAKTEDFFGPREADLLVEAALDISFALDHLASEDQRHLTEAALVESQRLLRASEEAGGIGTYTWFIPEDRWTSSPYLDRIFGIGEDYPRDLAGWMGLVAPEFREKLSTYVSRIVQRHERFDLDYPIIRVSDGAHRWVHGEGDIQRDAAGQPTALMGIIQDIDERITAEQALRKISVAVEQSPLSIVITNPNGRIEYVNPAFTQVTGYTASEAIGQNPRILKSSSTPPEHYRHMWDTLARGDIWVGEFENLKKNGEMFFERATIAPVRDEDGSAVGYIAIKEDITQLKKSEVERQFLESQLHQAQRLESLGSLAGGVAHDMNNVLGAILGLSSTLRETADPHSLERKSLDTIVNACLRGRGVVKSLLYFAKKDLQEERPIDLNDLVREMSQLLGHTTLKRIQLHLDLQEGIGLLRGDPGALSHALMNLCVNAMDAMPGGGALHLRTYKDHLGDLILSVRDTGAGMPAEVLGKAMEPFFTTKPQGEGTGLGLPMVFGTMAAHEGNFHLSSEPGQGTEAVMRFPANRVTPQVPATDVTPALSFASSQALQVLLVDDDELIREAVSPLLEMLGHSVVTAAGGAEALDMLQAGQTVDLVILDMNMPGMGGAQALPRILSLRPGLTVIMATGYSDHEIAPLLEGRPGVTSIRKPFSLKELQLKISSLQIQSSRKP